MSSLFRIYPSVLRRETSVPTSKSQTLRAILFASMAKGNSEIRHVLPSPDTDAMISACQHFGAKIERGYDSLSITGLGGQINCAQDVIHAGNSGIVLRFCAAIGALAPHPVVITGDHSVKTSRPMLPLLAGLSQLGVSALSMRGDGYAPVIIQGPLKGGKAELCGIDSQPVSALLIAGAFAKQPIELCVRNPGEKPWVALTLHWFDRLGIPYQQNGFEHFRLSVNEPYAGFKYDVPGDLSSAAFPIVAALITGSELTVCNVNLEDPQGDKILISILQSMGAKITYDRDRHMLHIQAGERLKGQAIDLNDCIDAITILAVVGCYAEGETVLYNAAVARHKECNRISCLVQELSKMGADIVETADGLRIRRSLLRGTQVHSHYDHRMAMSLAVAALGAEGETIVQETDCIAKTYPTFVQDFQRMGAKISLDASSS